MWHVTCNLQVEIYEDFIVDCINRLKAMFDTISALDRNNDNMTRINQEAQRMIRILTILRVYIADCDEAYSDERAILPLYRHVVMMNSLFSEFIDTSALYIEVPMCLEVCACWLWYTVPLFNGHFPGELGLSVCPSLHGAERAGLVPWAGGPPDLSFGFYLREVFQSQTHTEKIL